MTSQEHVAAQIPRDAAADEHLIALQWSPLHTARTLLGATSAGAVYTWTQSPMAPTADRATSLDEWFCYQAFKAPAEPGTLFYSLAAKAVFSLPIPACQCKTRFVLVWL